MSDLDLLDLDICEIRLDETKMIPYRNKFKTGLKNTDTNIPYEFVYFETKQEVYDQLIIMLRDVAAKYIKRIIDIQSFPGYVHTCKHGHKPNIQSVKRTSEILGLNKPVDN